MRKVEILPTRNHEAGYGPVSRGDLHRSKRSTFWGSCNPPHIYPDGDNIMLIMVIVQGIKSNW